MPPSTRWRWRSKNSIEKGDTMSNFVLVHGAWHGGWCWRNVAEPLLAAEHGVFAPSLCGMGEHAHHLRLIEGARITLQTHVQDIASLIESHDLCDVVLVGHSYGGLIITGAFDALLESGRITRLVYVDALVPRPGDAWHHFHTAQARAARDTAALAAGGQVLPVPDAAIFGLEDPAQRAWVQSRLTPHPYGCYTSALALPNLARLHARFPGGALPVARQYIDCVKPFYSDFGGLKQRLAADPHWDYVRIETGHDIMVSEPEGLAQLLLDH
jgi:pimeloyl-ACP methyl ester carboxylesterase